MIVLLAIRQFLKLLLRKVIQMNAQLETLTAAVNAGNDLSQQILDRIPKIPRSTPPEDLQPVIDAVSADNAKKQAAIEALDALAAPPA